AAVVPSHGEVVMVEPAEGGAERVARLAATDLPPDRAEVRAGPDTVPLSLDGVTVTGAQVEADLRPHEDADGSLVLEGTIRIRLRR
ncbi:MAG: hypothetical protein WCA30_17785, partial [Dermatophilaceae bacterium]